MFQTTNQIMYYNGGPLEENHTFRTVQLCRKHWTYNNFTSSNGSIMKLHKIADSMRVLSDPPWLVSCMLGAEATHQSSDDIAVVCHSCGQGSLSWQSMIQTTSIMPICSMYGIFTYMWVIFWAHVGK